MVFGFLDGSRNLERSTASLGASLPSDVTFPSLMMSFHFSSFSRSDLPWISILIMVQVPSSSANFFPSWPPAWPAMKAPIAKSDNATNRVVIDVLLLLPNDPAQLPGQSG